MQTSTQITTFRTPVTAEFIHFARWPQEFVEIYQRAQKENKGFVILGQGANILFTDDFHGHIVINQHKGIQVINRPDYYQVKVHSGVTINELIDYCLRFKIYGLENLSSIPSSIGTAVVGNIGAYGIEFSEFVHKVEVLNLETQEVFYLNKDECAFEYRNSIFKTTYREQYVVLSVELHLSKDYQPVLTYTPLDQLPTNTNPKEIRKLIDQTRAQKLPNYQEFGNAGSFFINPIVNQSTYDKIVKNFTSTHADSGAHNTPIIPHWRVVKDNQPMVKLSAGWLIEKSGLKGFQLGNAAVSSKHALVLINATGKASGQEIVTLAAYVQNVVREKFGIELHPEIRFIGKTHEVAFKDLSQKLPTC